jgi:hypothetical protein
MLVVRVGPADPGQRYARVPGGEREVGVLAAVPLVGLVEAADRAPGPGGQREGHVLLGPAEAPAIRIDSTRARCRRAAWGEDLFETRVVPDAEVAALDADPGLAGYLGGWA